MWAGSVILQPSFDTSARTAFCVAASPLAPQASCMTASQQAVGAPSGTPSSSSTSQMPVHSPRPASRSVFWQVGQAAIIVGLPRRSSSERSCAQVSSKSSSRPAQLEMTPQQPSSMPTPPSSRARKSA